MLLQCPHCNQTCETEQELAVGQHVVCPFCNVKFSYGESTAKAKKDQAVLIYCPKCSRQIVWQKSRLKENSLCPHCGHSFVAKLPRRESSCKKNVIQVLSIIFAMIACVVGKEFGHEIYVRTWPGAKEHVAYKELNGEIKEYSDHFRQYGQTIRNSGVLDLYTSETGKELRGEIEKDKYRRAIESSLKEAQSLNAWCNGKVTTFHPDVPQAAIELKNMIQEVYQSFSELTSLGKELFSKTLKCHQVCCGMLDGASASDKKVMEEYVRGMKDADNFGREQSRSIEEKKKAAASALCCEVYMMAKKYSDQERLKMAKIADSAKRSGTKKERKQ